MDDLIEKYNEIVTKKQDVIKQINTLEENEMIKKYNSLRKLNNELMIKQKNLFTQIRENNYSSCNHIWVNTLHEEDNLEGRSYNYYGCIKCGLDKRVFHIMDKYNDSNCLDLNKQIMYNYLNHHRNNSGIYTQICCDLTLATAIYKKIKERHPDIDDETTIKYLNAALHNIRKNNDAEKIKANRAKRLSLRVDFNKWKSSDITK